MKIAMDMISDNDSNIQILKSFISDFISSLSSKSFSLGLGLMLLDQTHSAMSFGINMIISPLVSLVFLIPIGNLVDRFQHKKILLANILIRVVALIIFLLSLSVFSGKSIILPTLVFVTINAITVNISDTCYSASVHELVNEQKIQKLSSITQTAIAISTVLSPAIGVVLYSWVGFSGFILVGIIANLLASIVVVSMTFHYEASSGKQINQTELGIKNQLENFKESFAFIKENNIIVYIILFSIILNFFYTSLVIGVPFIIKQQFHFGNTTVGLLETASAVGMLVGSISLSLLPDRKKERRVLFLSIAIPLLILDLQIIVLGGVFTIFKSQQMISAFGSLSVGIVALSLVVLNIIVQAYLQTIIPTKFLGRVMGTLFATSPNSSFTLVFLPYHLRN
ncbi:MFS-type transporter involved in bile tolerance, Atg22 family [Streptococcus gallolyticus]|uniref:MFS-type transporter involved in bile tolerance, Atg22 family n=1 Tax=Streptococcus gallolyticus TaxID=315405 RepID=A0A1H7XFG6_9STRE|nr:MFS transporter [Streptococcus gallolyticus]SEF23277.1 MFS-type transporter involved in bile tolerance, Atg22 family [Streptococcus gallolyticus]SEM32413.1 MFS-type transporter involved in bile tolerance, Atg22 family [Streptococcus gallolyticus]